MNVSQLESPSGPVSQIQRFSVDATEKDANFLSFRQLNKRARVRLSPRPFAPEQLPVKSNLLSVAHSKGWFTAAIQESSGFSLIFAPLADLHAAFSSSGQNDEIPFTPQRTLAIAPATPTIVVFASHDLRMLLSLTNGQILVYDTSRLFMSGSDNIVPLHSFPSLSSSAPRQILPNPGDVPDLVAVLREPGASQSVEILDVQKLEPVGGWHGGNTPDTTPTSLSWSPKGKQLGVGLLSGDILTFSPSATGSPKLRIPPLLLNEPQTLISTTWLSSPTFHVIYAPSSPPDAEQCHFVVTQDPKSPSMSSSKFNLPIYSLPGLTSSPFTLLLRNWDPVKMILLIGDRSSSDIGVVGSIGEDWHSFSLEETATPRLPLDKDGNETILLAFEIDLSSSQPLHTSIAGEEVELPPPPVMYAYTSDGTLQGWYIVNAQRTAYPGMMPLSASSPSPLGPSMIQNQSQAEAASSTFVSRASMSPPQSQAIVMGSGASAFGQPSMSGSQGSVFSGQTASAFGQPSHTGSAFGQQPSGFTQSSAFGQSSFGQPSAFGQSASGSSPFGQSSAFDQLSSGSTAFGQSSTFSQAKPIAGSTFGSTLSAGIGFGSFASEAPTKFGQTSFGFGSTVSPPAATMSTTPPSQSALSSAEDDMSMDAGSSFGGLTLGGSSDSVGKSKSAFGSGIFEQTPSPLSLPPNHPTNQLGSSFASAGIEAIKPASGFGAFGSLVQQPSLSQGPSQHSEEPKPAAASAFGKSGFDSKPTSVFGQPSFAIGAPAVVAPSSGGFGAFASGGPTTFGAMPQSGANAKPVWSTGGGVFGASRGESTKGTFTSGSVSAFGGGPVFGSREPIQNTPVKSSAKTNVFPSPSSSPEPGRSPSPFGANDSPPPASPFNSSSPAVATGAFGQLKTSSTGFVRPASGFGAFGNDTKPVASPFFNPSSGTKPVSVFASPPSSSPAANTGATTPTFGTSSALGSGKSTFGASPTTPTPVKTPAATAGGFSAFSGSSVGFGAFAGTLKPFSDLLKGSNDAKDLEKPSPSVFSSAPKPSGDATSAMTLPTVPNVKTVNDEKKPSLPPGNSVTQKSPDPVFRPPARDSSTSVTSVFSLTGFSPKAKEDAVSSPGSVKGKEISDSKPVNDGPTKEKENAESRPAANRADAPKPPIPVFSAPEKLKSDVEITSGDRKVTKDTDQANLASSFPKGVNIKDEATAPLSDEPSFGSLSLLSQNSSFVEVSDTEGQAEGSYSEHDGDGDESEHTDEQLEDETQSFISEGFSEDSEGLPDDEHSSEETGSSSSSSPVEPTKIPLPTTPQSMSRSPSTTPKPEIPTIGVTPSPSSGSEHSTLSQRSPSPNVRDASTTPPGSPDKEPCPPLPKSPLPAPAPVLPSASTTPFGVGLGRPSTRPTRSSPLANVTVSEDNGNDQDPITVTPSRSASPKGMPKLHPASPKPTFGHWTGPAKPGMPEDEPSGSKATRPSTPPLLSSFSTPATKNPLGLSPSAVMSSTIPPPPTSLVIGAPQGSTTPLSSPVGLFGTKTPVSTMVPPLNLDMFGSKATGSLSSPPMFVAGSLSGTKPTTSMFTSPHVGIFDGKTASFPPGNAKSTVFSTTIVKTAPTLGSPEPTLEQGMQAECVHLFSSLGRELEDLRKLAQQASQKRAELGKPFGSSRHPDLGDHTKWTLGNLGQMMKELKKDIHELKAQRDTHLKAIRELESHMLKAGTRKEEIARFNKAKTDVEFAKMLKLRTLGPEHMETQSQLRRDIKTMRDRVQKLEDHLQASKKKLIQMQKGMPGLKAPSLDTINRTYRNIDIAIEQQAQDVASLRLRMAKLNTTSALHLPSTRDKRLPDTRSRRPVNVTPHVAISTAAALNAERSAQKLKLALLAVRKEPLLNVEAASTLAPVVFDSPRKSNTDDRGQLLAWSIPDFNESPTHALPSRRTSGVVSKRHLPPIALKRSPASQPVTPPKFDWGPLPSITPMKTISADVRRKGVGLPEIQKPLGGSWVTDDFDKK